MQFDLTDWVRKLFCRERGPMTEAQRVGLWGEKVAERFLRRKKYKIIGRRLKIGERDELDLVAKDGKILVFVEVKTRKSEDFGAPATAVDRRKRSALSRAAVAYLRALGFPRLSFRFDIVEVVGTPDGGDPAIRHIENAFPLDGRYQLPY